MRAKLPHVRCGPFSLLQCRLEVILDAPTPVGNGGRHAIHFDARHLQRLTSPLKLRFGQIVRVDAIHIPQLDVPLSQSTCRGNLPVQIEHRLIRQTGKIHFPPSNASALSLPVITDFASTATTNPTPASRALSSFTPEPKPIAPLPSAPPKSGILRSSGMATPRIASFLTRHSAMAFFTPITISGRHPFSPLSLPKNSCFLGGNKKIDRAGGP